MNYEVPAGTASGIATVTLRNASASIIGTAVIGATAPGLYTANATGEGPAAAQVVAGQNYVPTFLCDANGHNRTPAPIDPGGPTLPYLILYGTGIRHRSSVANVSVAIGNVNAPVAYAWRELAFQKRRLR